MSGLIRSLFIGLNSAVVVVGGVLLTLSLLFIADRATARAFLTPVLQEEELVDQVMKIGTSIASTTLVIGLVVCSVAGLGCWGALTAHSMMLNIYMALVGVLSVLTFAFLIFFSVNKSKVLARAYDHLVVKLKTGYDGDYEALSTITLTIDALQIYFECCGIYNASEYDQASSWTNRTFGSFEDLTYPPTCCAWSKNESKSLGAISEESFHDIQTCMEHSAEEPYNTSKLAEASNFNKPCHKKINKYATSKMGTVFAVGSITFVVEFGALFMAYVFKKKAMDDD